MNQKTWRERVDLLETYAKQLDLTLAASGAVPLNHLVPQIEMGDSKFWTCPHCGRLQTEMSILEVERRDDSMEFTPPDADLELMGAWEPEGDATGESEQINYLCPDCSGFVYPVEEVLWG